MYIRNGQNVLKPNVSSIPDISEIAPAKKTEIPETEPLPSDDKPSNLSASPKSVGADSDKNVQHDNVWENHKILDSHKRKKRDRRVKQKTEKRTNRLTEYLYGRKYYILLFSVIYIVGLIVGAILIKSADSESIAVLRSAVDTYFTDVPQSDMVLRIINNIAVNAVLLFFAYLSGITVFAPFVSAVICSYKGLSCGYIIGVYISGGADLFHVAVCCITFVFYLLVMLFYIVSCSESMGFSMFLLKSRESLRNSLSLRNIGIYSVRYIFLLILTSIFIVVQTIVIPAVYSAYY